jgi:hypothetical protein
VLSITILGLKMTEFEKEVEIRLAKQAQNEPIKDLASSFMSASLAQKYSYNFLQCKS